MCSHPKPDEERATVAAQIEALTSGDTDPITLADLRTALARLKKGTSPGLDNWTTEALQKLSNDALPTLLRIYQYIETTGRWPPSLLRTKITLLVKPGCDGSSPSHCRPLAITSLWYRLYGQLRLPSLLRCVLPWLPPGVLGGIPNHCERCF